LRVIIIALPFFDSQDIVTN